MLFLSPCFVVFFFLLGSLWAMPFRTDLCLQFRGPVQYMEKLYPKGHTAQSSNKISHEKPKHLPRKAFSLVQSNLFNKKQVPQSILFARSKRFNNHKSCFALIKAQHLKKTPETFACGSLRPSGTTWDPGFPDGFGRAAGESLLAGVKPELGISAFSV